MKHKNKTNVWLNGVIAIFVLGFILNVPGMGRANPVRADGFKTNPGTFRSPTASQDFQVFLPLAYKNYPPIPDTPVLSAIVNPGSQPDYTLSWSSALRASSYVLEEDDNLAFSSPAVKYNGSALSWLALGKSAGTYYYRVKAVNSWGNSGWSNVQSTTVAPPQTSVYVINNVGCTLCYEITNTGIGRKCFSSWTNFYGTFPSGTYSYSASATCCGNAAGTKTFTGGTYDHTFTCIGSSASSANPSGLQCNLSLEYLIQPVGK